MESKYEWENELEKIIQSFATELSNIREREKLLTLLKKTTRNLATLLQNHIGKKLDDHKRLEVMEFFKKSVVCLNDLLPLDEPLRLGVKIPLDDPRIEFRLIDYIYTKHGHLPYIDDCYLSDQAGEYVACVFLDPKSRTPLN